MLVGSGLIWGTCRLGGIPTRVDCHAIYAGTIVPLRLTNESLSYHSVLHVNTVGVDTKMRQVRVFSD